MPGAPALAGALCLVTAFGFAAAQASPLPTRDQNPLLAGFGLPMPLPARVDPGHAWSIAADLNWSNSALAQSRASEYLIVDAETREARITVQRTLRAGTDRPALMLHLQVPYRYTGAGTLDGMIEEWHEAFGLPGGERAVLPRDDLRIEYRAGGDRRIDIADSERGPGDTSLALGYALTARPASAAAAWLHLKLPTGGAGRLTGSGAADASILVAGEHRFGGKWTAFGQAAVTWLGRGDLLPAQQRSVAWSGLAGLGWHLWRALELKVQLNAHTAVFERTRLDFLGDAAVLSVGAAYRFASGWQLDAGVSEDVLVETSPDVVFVLGLRHAR